MPESFFPPDPSFHLKIRTTPPEEFFRFMPFPIPQGGTPEQQRVAAVLRHDFADQARDVYERGDSEGADALMRLVNEITSDTVRFMAERDRHINPLHQRDEHRIPGFVAAHYTGGRGEVHNPANRFEPTALAQVELPPLLQRRLESL